MGSGGRTQVTRLGGNHLYQVSCFSYCYDKTPSKGSFRKWGIVVSPSLKIQSPMQSKGGSRRKRAGTTGARLPSPFIQSRTLGLCNAVAHCWVSPETSGNLSRKSVIGAPRSSSPKCSQCLSNWQSVWTTCISYSFYCCDKMPWQKATQGGKASFHPWVVVWWKSGRKTAAGARRQELLIEKPWKELLLYDSSWRVQLAFL